MSGRVSSSTPDRTKAEHISIRNPKVRTLFTPSPRNRGTEIPRYRAQESCGTGTTAYQRGTTTYDFTGNQGFQFENAVLISEVWILGGVLEGAGGLVPEPEAMRSSYPCTSIVLTRTWTATANEGQKKRNIKTLNNGNREKKSEYDTCVPSPW